MSRDDDIPTDLIALGQYVWPQGETRQTLTHIFTDMAERVMHRLPWYDAGEHAPERDLHTVKDKKLVSAAHARLREILFNCLDTAYLEWADQPQSRDGMRAFVYPPMATDILGEWAEARGHDVMTALDDMSAKDSDTITVVSLHNHVNRRHNKLDDVRDLIEALAASERKILIGCNSWAWRYLCAATPIASSVTKCQTTPAFTGRALAALLEPVVNKAPKAKCYRAEASGDPIFDREDDGDLCDPYFDKLARRSLGIPWGAIEMFFDDTRSAAEIEDDPDAKQSVEDDRDTTWLRVSSNPDVPDHVVGVLAQAIQNLLIHEPCSRDFINETLPHPLPNGVWSQMIARGFLSETQHGLRHIPRHYAILRSTLGASGINLDQL